MGGKDLALLLFTMPPRCYCFHIVLCRESKGAEQREGAEGLWGTGFTAKGGGPLPVQATASNLSKAFIELQSRSPAPLFKAS